MHIWKTNQVHVKCKKILASGGSDVFHDKRFPGEGEKDFFFFFNRERDLVWKLKESIYNSKILILGIGIWCG